MSQRFGAILGLAVVLTCFFGLGTSAAPPDETKDKLDALEKQRAELQKQEGSIRDRLRTIQQEVRDLQKKQTELQQKLETLRKDTEKAKEKEYVVNVEIKGRLHHDTSVTDRWTVTAQGFSCELNFGKKKEFLEL